MGGKREDNPQIVRSTKSRLINHILRTIHIDWIELLTVVSKKSM